MAATSTYTTGTASVAGGNTAVTGTGTSWLTSGIQAGDLFWANGLSCRIAAVISNTSLTLAYPWPGSSVVGGTYEIRYTPDATRVLASARKVIDMLDNGTIAALALAGSAANKFPFYSGAGAAELADITAFGRTFLGKANAAQARDALAPLSQVFFGVGSDESEIQLASQSRIEVDFVAVGKSAVVTFDLAFSAASQVDVVLGITLANLSAGGEFSQGETVSSPSPGPTASARSNVTSVFSALTPGYSYRAKLNVRKTSPVVVTPRYMRAYVLNV